MSQDREREHISSANMTPSPFVFLSHPGLASQQPHDDISLECISRMLMEEDIVDKFFYQYPDHDALQQAQHPFAQILSTSGAATCHAQHPSAMLPGEGSNTQGKSSAFFFNGKDKMEPNSNMDVLSSMAFFRGMEEANSFLPTNYGLVDCSGRKNMSHSGNAEVETEPPRRSNQIAVLIQPESKEEEAACKILDQLMLGYAICSYEVHSDMEKENKAEQQRICKKAPCARYGPRLLAVDDLETLLIRCAEAVATNDRRSACELTWRIKRQSSPIGDATQRLAHYFAEGLEARLAGRGSQLYRSLMAKRTPVVELLKAYKLVMSVCCFLRVFFLFTNKTIYNAVMGRNKLHIVHYGVNDGFQWPHLFRCLADRDGGPPAVRITGITSPMPEFRPAEQIEDISPRPGFRPAEQIEDIERRLTNCARQFGVPFKFRAITAKSEDVRVEDLNINPDEVLIVNSLLHFRYLMDESVVINRLNPRDMVLNTIREMKPAVFINAIVNASYNTTFFATRFRQVLHNFAAHFDMMETTVPRDNHERLLVERDIIARCAMNNIACEGRDRVERPQNYREWQIRKQRAGLRQLPLDPDIVQMLKAKVKKQYNKHFMINEEHQWLLQGWKGRMLYALSTWVADDGSSSQVT